MVKILTDCLNPFLSKPFASMHQAELSRATNIKHTTIRLWLNELESLGVIKKDFKGKMTFYALNFQSQNIIGYVVIAEKFKLIRKCEESLILRELTDYLTKNIEGDTLIFGSSAESIEKANDIDLLVIGKVNVQNIDSISNKINKKIHLINPKNLTDISETLKNEIIKKHLLIKNSEKFLRWFLW